MRLRYLYLFVLVASLASASSLISPVFAPYRDYQSVMTDFMELADSFPDQMTHEVVGKTVLNKDIIMFKIGNPNGGKVLIDGAIHGGETIGPELLCFYAKWLLTSSDPLARRILSGTCTMLIPALNVDRYSGPRKNMNGVDLNRNFATDWDHAGSTDPDSESYRGTAPLSEPEPQTLIRVLQTFSPDFYVNLHMWAGPYYGGSYYGNRTYYSILASRISSLSYDRGVTPLRYSGQLGGAGFAISDAARVGVTSFLIELAETAIPYTDIKAVLLPRFIPLVAVLSQECETQTLFDDGFESGDFSAWSGVTLSPNDHADVVDLNPYSGTFSARFETGAISSGTKRAYTYKDINGSPTIYARACFYIADGLPLTDTDDRFTLIQFLSSSGSAISNLQIRHVQGEDRFTVLAFGSTQTTAGIYPEENKWYCLELLTCIHSTEGAVKGYINGVEYLSLTGMNTTELGNVATVRFGLANSIDIQHGLVVYCDCASISTSYIGTQIFPPWDVNEDGLVGMLDLVIVVKAFGSKPSDPHWNPDADVDKNDYINTLDLYIVSSHYGEEY